MYFYGCKQKNISFGNLLNDQYLLARAKRDEAHALLDEGRDHTVVKKLDQCQYGPVSEGATSGRIRERNLPENEGRFRRNRHSEGASAPLGLNEFNSLASAADNWQAQRMVMIPRYPRIGSGSVHLALFRFAFGAAAFSLSACTSLPTSGPTVHQVLKDTRPSQAVVPFTLVPLETATVSHSPRPLNPGIVKMAALARDPGPARADMIRPGDTLSISIFEVGVSLFGGGAVPAAGLGTALRTPTAATQTLNVEVREDGLIDLPYVGSAMAAGAYPEELAAVIRRHLKSLSENPEVSVSIAESVKNVVYLGGAIVKSGRYRLTAAHEHLLDALALAGGSAVDPNELEVRLQRGTEEVTAPLNQINPGDPADLPIHPGDRIQFVRVRSSYTVFGASDKVSQIYFEAKDVSLAEAIARAAGPSDYRANPRGVFLCRYETDSDGKLKPVVYQLNMMKTDAYFLAQSFPVHDKDVILFANSSGTMTQKLVNLISNLFSPAMAVRYATQ